MKRVFILAAILLLTAHPAIADGLINVPSQHPVKETADRLENILKEKGMVIFKRHDHAMAAKKVGVELRPTELIIFGNPKIGSPLMKCQQTIAIDLPQKALIWQDQANRGGISYNDPSYLARRHKMTGCHKVLGTVTGALAAMTAKAAKK